MKTRKLRILCGKAVLTFESESSHKLASLSEFCKTLGAINLSEDPYELMIDSPTEIVISKIHSLAFELGLF